VVAISITDVAMFIVKLRNVV